MRNVLMLMCENKALRFVSHISDENKDRIVDIIEGDEKVMATIKCPELTVMLKCQNGSILLFKS